MSNRKLLNNGDFIYSNAYVIRDPKTNALSTSNFVNYENPNNIDVNNPLSQHIVDKLNETVGVLKSNISNSEKLRASLSFEWNSCSLKSGLGGTLVSSVSSFTNTNLLNLPQHERKPITKEIIKQAEFKPFKLLTTNRSEFNESRFTDEKRDSIFQTLNLQVGATLENKETNKWKAITKHIKGLNLKEIEDLGKSDSEYESRKEFLIGLHGKHIEHIYSKEAHEFLFSKIGIYTLADILEQIVDDFKITNQYDLAYIVNYIRSNDDFRAGLRTKFYEKYDNSNENSESVSLQINEFLRATERPEYPLTEDINYLRDFFQVTLQLNFPEFSIFPNVLDRIDYHSGVSSVYDHANYFGTKEDIFKKGLLVHNPNAQSEVKAGVVYYDYDSCYDQFKDLIKKIAGGRQVHFKNFTTKEGTPYVGGNSTTSKNLELGIKANSTFTWMLFPNGNTKEDGSIQQPVGIIRNFKDEVLFSVRFNTTANGTVMTIQDSQDKKVGEINKSSRLQRVVRNNQAPANSNPNQKLQLGAISLARKEYYYQSMFADSMRREYELELKNKIESFLRPLRKFELVKFVNSTDISHQQFFDDLKIELNKHRDTFYLLAKLGLFTSKYGRSTGISRTFGSLGLVKESLTPRPPFIYKNKTYKDSNKAIPLSHDSYVNNNYIKSKFLNLIEPSPKLITKRPDLFNNPFMNPNCVLNWTEEVNKEWRGSEIPTGVSKNIKSLLVEGVNLNFDKLQYLVYSGGLHYINEYISGNLINNDIHINAEEFHQSLLNKTQVQHMKNPNQGKNLELEIQEFNQAFFNRADTYHLFNKVMTGYSLIKTAEIFNHTRADDIKHSLANELKGVINPLEPDHLKGTDIGYMLGYSKNPSVNFLSAYRNGSDKVVSSDITNGFFLVGHKIEDIINNIKEGEDKPLYPSAIQVYKSYELNGTPQTSKLFLTNSDKLGSFADIGSTTLSELVKEQLEGNDVSPKVFVGEGYATVEAYRILKSDPNDYNEAVIVAFDVGNLNIILDKLNELNSELKKQGALPLEVHVGFDNDIKNDFKHNKGLQSYLSTKDKGYDNFVLDIPFAPLEGYKVDSNNNVTNYIRANTDRISDFNDLLVATTGDKNLLREIIQVKGIKDLVTQRNALELSFKEFYRVFDKPNSISMLDHENSIPEPTLDIFKPETNLSEVKQLKNPSSEQPVHSQEVTGFNQTIKQATTQVFSYNEPVSKSKDIEPVEPSVESERNYKDVDINHQAQSNPSNPFIEPKEDELDILSEMMTQEHVFDDKIDKNRLSKQTFGKSNLSL